MLTVEVAASYPEDKFSTGPRRPKTSSGYGESYRNSTAT